MEKATKEIRIARYEAKREQCITQFTAGLILMIVSTMEMYAAANINELSASFGGGNDVVSVFCLIISLLGFAFSIMIMYRAARMYEKAVIDLELTKKTKINKIKIVKKQ